MKYELLINRRCRYLLACFALFVFPACATAPGQHQIKMESSQKIEEKVAWSSHSKAPDWVYRPPESDGKYDYFVALSHKHSSEQAARNAAMRDALTQFVRFCGVEVSIFDDYLKTTTGKTSGILAGVLDNKTSEQQQAQAFVSRIKPKEWYLNEVRVFHDDIPISTGWKASVLVMVPIEEKENVRAYGEKLRKKKELSKKNKHLTDVEKIKNSLQPAAEFYYQAKKNIESGDVLGAIRILERAQKIIKQSEGEKYFPEAKDALQREITEKAIDMVEVLINSLKQGIILTKVSGDGQRITADQPLPKPLVVRAVCSYGGREIPIASTEIAFSISGQTIDKVFTDKKGIGKLDKYTFGKKHKSKIMVIAQLSAKGSDAFFNLFINEPIAKKQEEKLAVEVNFFYENNGVARELKNGVTLRSRVDYYYLYFKPEQDCYVYIYQVDSSGAVYQLFPNLEYSNSWNPVKKRKAYYIPNKDQFYLDDVVGGEQIYLLAYKKPATAIEKMFAEMNASNNAAARRGIENKIKTSLSSMANTRGIGGTAGRPHKVKISSGETFEILNKKLESAGAGLVYGVNFIHAKN